MYAINEIELIKFFGMWLNNVDRFQLKVTSQTNVILGRNGCGKSKLMANLHPMAINKNDFDDGGRKRFDFTYNGVKYRVLSYRVKGSVKNDFTNLTTGETIHSGANSQVHNETIFQLMGYDKELHSLLTGQDILTNMRGPERKRWFSKLSESDLSYALKFYQKAREHLRDITGSINTTKDEIGELQIRIVNNEEDYAALKIRLEELRSEITLIDEEISQCNANPSISESTLDEVDMRLNSINRAIQATKHFIPKSISGFDVHRNNQVITTAQVKYEQVMTEIESISKKLEHAKKLENIDLNLVIKRRDELLAIKDGIIAQQGTFASIIAVERSEVSGAKMIYGTIMKDLVNIMNELTGDHNFAELGTTLQVKVGTAGGISENINRARHELAVLDGRLKHIHETHNVDCTKCGYTFKPGVKEDEEAALKERRTMLENYLTNANAEVTALNNEIKQLTWLSSIQSRANDMIRYVDGNPAWQKFFGYLIREGAFLGKGGAMTGAVTQFGRDIELTMDLVNVLDQLAKVEVDYTIIKASQQDDSSELEAKLEALTTAAGKYQDCIRDRQAEAALYNATMERMATLDGLEKDLYECIEKRSDIAVTLFENIRLELLNEQRNEQWSFLVTVNQRFTQMDDERKKLASLLERVKDLEGRQIAASKVVAAMSPEEGILAKHLYQCITKITDLMTAYINRIWGYEMNIMPCDVEDGDLDYRFPFWNGDRAKMSPDVREASRGQREVFDFVFMLTVYAALKHEGFPLFLDELGSGFDESHRPNMVNFLKSLLDSGQHSQIFMVSHDAGTHFQLTHADVIVIDPIGVTLPKVYNKSVIIE